MPHLRLDEFRHWRGWTQAELAAACGAKMRDGVLSQAAISLVMLGKRSPGLALAHAIERVTGEPREDGERWAPGPIRTEDWLKAADSKPDAA